MEVFVASPFVRFINFSVPHNSTVSDLIGLLSPGEAISCLDFYVKKNGRISGGDERLQAGAVYRLEPRLCGGKGGFGSMLRALGAQIEKTTNREACRDLSGRRLRDVNHEKEMAEWLKKQADRDAEKEQRRLERIQRKLAEPKHRFTDTEYEQQCHDLSERLEDSILKGMQASSSGVVQAEEKPHRKRPATKNGNTSSKKKCFWTGLGDLENMDSSDGDSDESEAEASSSSSSSSSTSSSNAGPSCSSVPVAIPATATREQVESESHDHTSSSSSSSSAGSAPCSPPPSQDKAEEKEEPRRMEHSEKEECNQTVSDQQEAEKSVTVEGKDCADKPPVQTEEADAPLDLLSVSGVEELEALGLERLKAELTKKGMKCGGTLQERAARLYSVRGLGTDQINPALLAKPGKAKKK
ncbi:splicing regulator SDE2 [Clarias gariepinus]|uniref:splicing regulator SDE2 n=1 Tax=Clarias gariepinus TaxID=13013 RepID=UPI00234DAC32|nr:splicing regulator SDE2 [Clarias gariepinus]